MFLYPNYGIFTNKAIKSKNVFGKYKNVLYFCVIKRSESDFDPIAEMGELLKTLNQIMKRLVEVLYSLTKKKIPHHSLAIKNI